MPNCKHCGKPVASGVVLHSECYDLCVKDAARYGEMAEANLREKLVKLIRHCTSCEECRDEDIADHLIANGVTVQDGKDTDVPTKWIPVTERLPDPLVSVLAYVPSESPLPLVHESYMVDETLWVCIVERRPWKQGAVTHWMPMPEPPKGEA